MALLAAIAAGCGPERAASVPSANSAINGLTPTSASRSTAGNHSRPDTEAFHGLEAEADAPLPDLNAPLAEDAHFFTPPKIAAPAKQIMKSDQGHAPVRLLGFVGDEDTKPGSRKAILKVGNRMATIGAGESVDGIELLSIQGRSITMQRDRDRWTLALFDQPVVHQSKTRPPQSPRRRRPTRSGQRERHTTPAPVAAAAPAVPSSGAPSFEAPILDLPEPPAPPDLGDLPGLEDLPGI